MSCLMFTVIFFVALGLQLSPVHTTPEKFENATITGHFGYVFEENAVREII